jgi:inositol phosphorylceramide synthase catalytic subunit
MKIWRHMRELWPSFTLAPALPFWGWAVFWSVRGELRWDHVAVAVLVSVLAYSNAKTKRLFVGLLPVGLVALFYDGMRFVKNVGLSESNVHVCDLRAAELRWFGVNAGGARVTLHDWLQAHAATGFDVFFAIPYGTFILVVIAYCVFLYRRHFSVLQRFTWAFLVLNVAGFLTYHVYPAAPPWYFHQHGCAVDLATAASAGPNLLRVDALMGWNYFAGFYGRSSDVFGAVPSLHVAYPLLMVTEGWRLHRALGRSLLVAFYAWMCCAAVYLDHHWVIDIVLGSGYALATALAIRQLEKWRRSRAEPHVSSPAQEVTHGHG